MKLYLFLMIPICFVFVYHLLMGSVQENNKWNLIGILIIVVFVILQEIKTTKFYFDDTYFRVDKSRRKLSEIQTIQGMYGTNKKATRGVGHLLIMLKSGEKFKVSTRINEYQYNYFIKLMDKKYKIGLD